MKNSALILYSLNKFLKFSIWISKFILWYVKYNLRYKYILDYNKPLINCSYGKFDSFWNANLKWSFLNFNMEHIFKKYKNS